MSSCTYTIFKAVQRCPLYESVPAIHSFTAKSISASGKIIAGFFASKPNTNLNLFDLGCKFCNAFADELCPIKANTSTLPDFIIGDATALPLPYKTFTTPGGKLS